VAALEDRTFAAAQPADRIVTGVALRAAIGIGPRGLEAPAAVVARDRDQGALCDSVLRERARDRADLEIQLDQEVRARADATRAGNANTGLEFRGRQRRPVQRLRRVVEKERALGVPPLMFGDEGDGFASQERTGQTRVPIGVAEGSAHERAVSSQTSKWIEWC
jgi:hypothetical protein